jgi:maleate isomerase
MTLLHETRDGFVNITGIPFEIDEGIAGRARIGLIVLASDHTMEHEFRQVVTMPGVALYEARIPNSPTITPDTLRAMAEHIADRAALILPGVLLDVVAYGCTAASIVLGEERVFELIRDGRPEALPTTPITAAFAAFRALGKTRIGVLTPYRDDVNHMVRQYIINNGFEVPVFGSFNEDDDNRAARISSDSIRSAILDIGQHDDVDAVFLSCTSLRLTGIVNQVEQQLAKPVTSSNHALIWHALRLAGVKEAIPGYGMLYHLPADRS